MKPIRILLNRRIAGNYAFFCPETGLHLGITTPMGFTTRLSASILRGLRGGTLIDVDKRVDIEKGIILDKEDIPNMLHQQKNNKQEEVKEEIVQENIKEETSKTSKKSRKTSAAKAE